MNCEATMLPLEETADRQAMWSSVANRLKAKYDRARQVTFALSIVAALLATIASQLENKPRLYLSVTSAVMLGLVSFLSARLLGSVRASAWVRARAASEALKREGFKFASSAVPYNDPATRDSLLNEEREKIERDVEDLLGEAVPASGKGSVPRSLLPPEGYIETRVRGQVEKYYEPKAETYRRAASTLRTVEFGLSLVAAIITAAVGVAGKELFGLRFDFVALTAVLTTIAGAIIAHIEASRYDFLVMTYRAAARGSGTSWRVGLLPIS
jgi:Protein of unknown function (DUF4231)/SMODS and SLOG-associating 2TM effector domain 1